MAKALLEGSPEEQRVASLAMEYVAQQVGAKHGKSCWGEVTLKLIWKGNLAELQMTDHVIVRTKKSVAESRDTSTAGPSEH